MNNDALEVEAAKQLREMVEGNLDLGPKIAKLVKAQVQAQDILKKLKSGDVG